MVKPGYDCEWCEGKKDCPSIEPTVGLCPGYACSRPDGHMGSHVACLIVNHKVAEWNAIRIEDQPS